MKLATTKTKKQKVEFPLRKNISLASISNYKLGGVASYISEPTTVEIAILALEWAHENKQSVFIWGSGTNILPSDDGYQGLILHPKFSEINLSKNEVTVGSGVLMKDLLKFTIKNKLSGLEWAGGLPGTVGGAVRGNAGCFGGEIKDNVKEVISLNIKNKKIKKRTNKQCQFQYRQSIFKKHGGRDLIVSVRLKLKSGDVSQIRKSIAERVAYRKERHPIEYPNAGSMFKNVPWKQVPDKQKPTLKEVIKIDPFPVVPTAYLLSECNLKGKTFGGAKISEKHPNFIINFNHATTHDVKSLLFVMKQAVYKKFGIKIEEEIFILS
jgi:UDP-N-acetylmuramate dehydrogenase